MMTEFKSVEECLKAGFSWEKCVGLQVTDTGMKAVIKKTCPIPMREELKKRVFSGGEVTFTTEK